MSSCIGMMMNEPCIGMMMDESEAIDYFKEEEVRVILADHGIAEEEADEICTPEFIHGLPETEEGIVEILAVKFGFDTP